MFCTKKEAIHVWESTHFNRNFILLYIVDGQREVEQREEKQINVTEKCYCIMYNVTATLTPIHITIIVIVFKSSNVSILVIIFT